jgi:2-polyprenyl-3-methyl-5-hydroxy-6-metoxy-1,4-benzoquinol methylase
MEVVERLTLEAAQADTMLACEHRHRYEFAVDLCAGRRVLDLCCGSGYGAAILAVGARKVVGVDNDAATIESAHLTVGRHVPNTGFELADAVTFLRGDIAGQFDVLVCFEGLEHLQDLEAALALMRGHAERGLQIVASVPNGKLFNEQNPFHLTQFGYDEAVAAFASFPSPVMLPQFLAEGSLICPPGAIESEIALTLEDRDEPEYANHFIFCVGFDAAALERVHRGNVQVNTSPNFNRLIADLQRAVRACHRENARLARARLGKGGSAAAAALAGIADREAQIAALRERCRIAEKRVSELEATVARAQAAPADSEVVSVGEALEAVEARTVAIQPGDDPTSWETRRRRAAEYLIPWIEQTLPLAGKTVLAYGCGDAAVSCAFAERAARVIGVDIDAGSIELGNEQVRKRSIHNIELGLHPPETIKDAAASTRGQIDVFVLYAVLDDLGVEERLTVLRLAREVVKPDGAIVVCETPNRLIYFDHHTAQMPFFHLLPDELALEYYPRSKREDFKDAIDVATQHGREAAMEAVVRWGRGVSFHEFEVVFGDLSRHVIASNYDPLLFGERTVHPDEVILARYLDRWRPDLAPVWSRCWLDLILAPQPVDRRPPFLWPWTADTVASKGVGWTGQESLLLKGLDATLSVTLPQPTGRLVVGTLTRDGRRLTLYARAEGSERTMIARHTAAPGCAAFTTFALREPAQRVSFEASDECEVVFVGYEG